LLISGPTADYVHQEIGSNVIYNGRPGGQRYYPDGLVKLDIPPKTDTKDVAVTLQRGVTVKGRLTGPDGKPVARALMFCRLHVASFDLFWRFPVEVRDGQFELHGCDPKESYPVYFLDPENKCGATVTVSGKQAGEEHKVRLAPCGQAVARFVDPQGKPVANHHPHLEMVITPGPNRYDFTAGDKGVLAADSELLANLDRLNYWKGPSTDAQGRCTFVALIPGATYRIAVFGKDGAVGVKEFTVESGKTAELPDITVGQPE
jgi:hypothetical protein